MRASDFGVVVAHTLSVVVDRDVVLGGIDVDLEHAHARVALLVVGGVHEDLVKDLVQAGHERHVALDHADAFIVHPDVLFLGLRHSCAGAAT